MHPIAINGQFLIFDGIRDHQRNQFFGKLVRPIIIGAPSDERRNSISTMISPDEHIGPRFTRGIRAIGREGRFLRESSGLAQRAVDFVGGDMKETDRVFRKDLPDRFEKNEGPEDIGLHEGTGVFDGSVDMGFGGKIDNSLDAFADQFLDSRGIYNIPSDEMITGRAREVGKVF
jgi:hypothetical protein